jgi:hypothetical protein
MLAYIPKKFKRWLLVVTIPCGAVVASYFFLPFIGLSYYVSGKDWFMYVCIAATIPPLVFRVAHVPVPTDRKANDRIESLFSLGLVAWLGAFALFVAGDGWFGAVTLAMAILLIGAAHLYWIAAFSRSQRSQ